MAYVWTKLDHQLYNQQERESSIMDAAEFMAKAVEKKEKEKKTSPQKQDCKLDNKTLNSFAKKLYSAICFLEKNTAKAYSKMALTNAKNMNEELNENPFKAADNNRAEQEQKRFKQKLLRERLTSAKVEALVRMNKEGLAAADERERRKYRL